MASDLVSSVIEDIEAGPHCLAQTEPSLSKGGPQRRQFAGIHVRWRARVLDEELRADDLAVYNDFYFHCPRSQTPDEM